MKQLPYNPKRKNSEESGYFKEDFFLKQQQKQASLFFNFLQALDQRAWKLVFLEIAWLESCRRSMNASRNSAQEMSLHAL